MDKGAGRASLLHLICVCSFVCVCVLCVETLKALRSGRPLGN